MPSAVHVLLPVINLQIFFGDRALVAKSEVRTMVAWSLLSASVRVRVRNDVVGLLL